MDLVHVPQIGRRYWCGIVLASISGTNLGDFYAHESGLGLWSGLLVLLILFAVICQAERRDRMVHEAYYWAAIIIVRTGATNIADYLAYRAAIPPSVLIPGLAAAIAVPAWLASARGPKNTSPLATASLAYWAAMLAAGVFGTVGGDICAHHFGKGPAAFGLGLLLITLLAIGGPRAAKLPALYWTALALARTAGTCMGDWCAESKTLAIGLPFSTLITTSLFAATLIVWRTLPRKTVSAT